MSVLLRYVGSTRSDLKQSEVLCIGCISVEVDADADNDAGLEAKVGVLATRVRNRGGKCVLFRGLGEIVVAEDVSEALWMEAGIPDTNKGAVRAATTKRKIGIMNIAHRSFLEM